MPSKSDFADQELSFAALERLISALSLAKKGDFSVRMAAEGDGMEREVADNLNELLSTLADFTRELDRVSESVTQGELRLRIGRDKAEGGWGQQLRALNNIVVTFGKHTVELRRVIKALHTGDLSRPMSMGPETIHRGGELQRIAEEFNGMLTHVGQITSEIARVFAEVGLDGRLNAQAHIGDASGCWGLLVGSVNAASASLSEQVQELCTTAQALASGQLSARATMTSRGDLQPLRLGLNGAADAMSALCNELRRVAQEVASEGKLGAELRHPDPRGEWQSAQDAVNRMLATLAASWRSTVSEIEGVIEGDYSRTSASVGAPGELDAAARVLSTLNEQQLRTQLSLKALIEGRFGQLSNSANNERELTLMQLEARLKREWYRSVRATIYEVREQPLDPEGFANALLSVLVEASGAVAGSYYGAGKDGRLLRLANLGCDLPENDVPLRPGEGLIGRAAHDGQPIFLDQLDEAGMRVRSGLLQLTPRSALIFPVAGERSVYAVIELLFMSDGGPKATELLAYLAPDLAKGPMHAAPAPSKSDDGSRVRELEEELVIANARLQQLASELQARERAARSTGS